MFCPLIISASAALAAAMTVLNDQNATPEAIAAVIPAAAVAAVALHDQEAMTTIFTSQSDATSSSSTTSSTSSSTESLGSVASADADPNFQDVALDDSSEISDEGTKLQSDVRLRNRRPTLQTHE